MIQKIEARQRYRAHQDWLDTYHLFSFANYFDPDNLQFGVLRVFNDDTIGAFSGFDEHSHDNMEIVTIVLEGELTHRDSLGNQSSIKAGEVQRMSAGTGIIHAEKNLGDELVHLYQLWLLPRTRQAKPSYEQKDFSYYPENQLTPVASGFELEGALTIDSAASIFVGVLEGGRHLEHSVERGNGTFIYLQSGQLVVNGIEVQMGDQLRIEHETTLSLKAMRDAKFILIDVEL